MTLRIGIDSGGTFTDICLFDKATGNVKVWKVSSTPGDPSDGIIAALGQGVENVGAKAADVSYFGHGTTVGTNALIQHRGARTGLITTDGFQDLLEIGRQKRPELYDIHADKPATLVSRDVRLGVRERVHHDGRVETGIDEAELRAVARQLRADGIEAVAICFLYGFLFTDHEQVARRVLTEEFPEAFVSVSHQVSPEFREYERMSSTAVNAYLGPVMKGYIERLEKRLVAFGISTVPHITQSNGGVLSFRTAADFPVRTILSGPSTGVVAAEAIGRLAGYDNLITFDMGGTSSDVALINDGVCRLTNEATVHGYPIKSPMLDIHTVGAGGGSIAYVDSGGLLKVGPRSAGADPGPVCYGKGNFEPTVTDANVVLQTLNPEYLLAGRMKIDQDLSRSAITNVAERLGLDTMVTAQGILSVVTANMAKAIRVISVQRGYDPRDYTLMAFGGAGPLHAARLARELEMGRVLIPRTPGTLCALGLLLTDLRTNFALTRLTLFGAGAETVITGAFTELEASAAAWFYHEEIAPKARHVRRLVDMRYRGQNYEIGVPVPESGFSAETADLLLQRFTEAHRKAYGFTANDPVELVTFRLEASGLVDKAEFSPRPAGGADPSGAIVGHRNIWLPECGGFAECPIYDREMLEPGNVFVGPAIVDQMDTTTIVLPGMTVSVDPYLNLIMEEQK